MVLYVEREGFWGRMEGMVWDGIFAKRRGICSVFLCVCVVWMEGWMDGWVDGWSR